MNYKPFNYKTLNELSEELSALGLENLPLSENIDILKEEFTMGNYKSMPVNFVERAEKET